MSGDAAPTEKVSEQDFMKAMASGGGRDQPSPRERLLECFTHDASETEHEFLDDVIKHGPTLVREFLKRVGHQKHGHLSDEFAHQCEAWIQLLHQFRTKTAEDPAKNYKNIEKIAGNIRERFEDYYQHAASFSKAHADPRAAKFSKEVAMQPGIAKYVKNRIAIMKLVAGSGANYRSEKVVEMLRRLHKNPKYQDEATQSMLTRMQNDAAEGLQLGHGPETITYSQFQQMLGTLATLPQKKLQIHRWLEQYPAHDNKPVHDALMQLQQELEPEVIPLPAFVAPAPRAPTPVVRKPPRPQTEVPVSGRSVSLSPAPPSVLPPRRERPTPSPTPSVAASEVSTTSASHGYNLQSELRSSVIEDELKLWKHYHRAVAAGEKFAGVHDPSIDAYRALYGGDRKQMPFRKGSTYEHSVQRFSHLKNLDHYVRPVKESTRDGVGGTTLKHFTLMGEHAKQSEHLANLLHKVVRRYRGHYETIFKDEGGRAPVGAHVNNDPQWYFQHLLPHVANHYITDAEVAPDHPIGKMYERVLKDFGAKDIPNEELPAVVTGGITKLRAILKRPGAKGGKNPFYRQILAFKSHLETWKTQNDRNFAGHPTLKNLPAAPFLREEYNYNIDDDELKKERRKAVRRPSKEVRLAKNINEMLPGPRRQDLIRRLHSTSDEGKKLAKQILADDEPKPLSKESLTALTQDLAKEKAAKAARRAEIRAAKEAAREREPSVDLTDDDSEPIRAKGTPKPKPSGPQIWGSQRYTDQLTGRAGHPDRFTHLNFVKKWIHQEQKRNKDVEKFFKRGPSEDDQHYLHRLRNFFAGTVYRGGRDPMNHHNILRAFGNRAARTKRFEQAAKTFFLMSAKGRSARNFNTPGFPILGLRKIGQGDSTRNRVFSMNHYVGGKPIGKPYDVRLRNTQRQTYAEHWDIPKALQYVREHINPYDVSRPPAPVAPRYETEPKAGAIRGLSRGLSMDSSDVPIGKPHESDAPIMPRILKARLGPVQLSPRTKAKRKRKKPETEEDTEDDTDDIDPSQTVTMTRPKRKTAALTKAKIARTAKIEQMPDDTEAVWDYWRSGILESATETAAAPFSAKRWARRKVKVIDLTHMTEEDASGQSKRVQVTPFHQKRWIDEILGLTGGMMTSIKTRAEKEGKLADVKQVINAPLQIFGPDRPPVSLNTIVASLRRGVTAKGKSLFDGFGKWAKMFAGPLRKYWQMDAYANEIERIAGRIGFKQEQAALPPVPVAVPAVKAKAVGTVGQKTGAGVKPPQTAAEVGYEPRVTLVPPFRKYYEWDDPTQQAFPDGTRVPRRVVAHNVREGTQILAKGVTKKGYFADVPRDADGKGIFSDVGIHLGEGEPRTANFSSPDHDEILGRVGKKFNRHASHLPVFGFHKDLTAAIRGGDTGFNTNQGGIRTWHQKVRRHPAGLVFNPKASFLAVRNRLLRWGFSPDAPLSKLYGVHSDSQFADQMPKYVVSRRYSRRTALLCAHFASRGAPKVSWRNRGSHRPWCQQGQNGARKPHGRKGRACICGLGHPRGGYRHGAV